MTRASRWLGSTFGGFVLALALALLVVGSIWLMCRMSKGQSMATTSYHPDRSDCVGWQTTRASHFNDRIGSTGRLPRRGYYVALPDTRLKRAWVEVAACGQRVAAQVLDYGPAERTGCGIDLSRDLFEEFANLAAGHVQVSWRRIEEE